MKLNNLTIRPITREQTRKELCSRIKNKEIKLEGIKQTLNNYLSFKQYKWDQKIFKTPFHSDPIHKTKQFLLCLKGNMRNEICKTNNELKFHQNLFNTHKLAPNVEFTRNQLKRDGQTLQKDRAKLANYKNVLGYLEKLDVHNGKVVCHSNKNTLF